MSENPILEAAVDAATSGIPIVGEAKAAFSVAKAVAPIVGAVLLALVVLLGLNTIFGFITDPFHLKAHQLAAAQTQAATATDNLVVAKGQNAAQTDAQKIVLAGSAKTDVTLHIQQDNQRAILAAPGASQVVDPGLVSTLDDGLCRYDAYAGNPGCNQVRPSDPGQLPQAGSGDGSAQVAGH